MNGPRDHLPSDLAALRYLDALAAGDLQAAADLWEAASHDPRLEQSLVEIDAALVAEAPKIYGQSVKGQLLNGQPRPSAIRSMSKLRSARRWPARAAALGALAAASWLMVVMRARRDESPRADRPAATVARRATAGPVSTPNLGPAHASRTQSADLSAWRQMRGALNGEPPPPFAWPLRSTLTTSISSDLLD